LTVERGEDRGTEGEALELVPADTVSPDPKVPLAGVSPGDGMDGTPDVAGVVVLQLAALVPFSMPVGAAETSKLKARATRQIARKV
jgi:hypothetical protein